jgi:hypothetical protein
MAKRKSPPREVHVLSLKGEFTVDGNHRCTAAPLLFPVRTGKLLKWEVWGLF